VQATQELWLGRDQRERLAPPEEVSLSLQSITGNLRDSCLQWMRSGCRNGAARAMGPPPKPAASLDSSGGRMTKLPRNTEAPDFSRTHPVKSMLEARREQKERTMTITIDPNLEARLRERAQSEGVTVAAYVERLVQADQAAEEELESLALEGLNSGEPIEVNPAFWEERHRRLDERLSSATR